jgi:hypothetical protein
MFTANPGVRRRAGAVAARLIACCALPATAVLPVDAADAAEPAPWSRHDPAGDAPPPADMTFASVHWGPKGRAVFVRVNVVDLQPAGQLRVSMGNDGETIHLVVKKTPTSLRAKVRNINFSGEQEFVRCPGIKVNWNAAGNFVFMDVPLGVCWGRGPWGTDGVRVKGPAGAVDTAGRIVWTGD